MLVDRWRTALGGPWPDGTEPGRRPDPTVVVANADDPMVVWAAPAAPDVRWVGAGQVWHNDAVGCPAVRRADRLRADGGVGLRPLRVRPPRAPGHAGSRGPVLVTAEARPPSVAIALPGQFNRANAAMAAVAATAMAGTPRRLRCRWPRRSPAALRRRPGGGAVLLHGAPTRPSGPAAAGQEPGRLDRHLRPAGRDDARRRSRGALGQRPDRRRPRHQLAVGRPLRAAGRPAGWWPPGTAGSTWPCACATPRSACAVVADPLVALDRATRARGRRRRASTSSATTPPSPTCGPAVTAAGHRAAPLHRGRGLPRPARHLRRRRQRAGPGPPGRLARDRRRPGPGRLVPARCPPATSTASGGGEDGPQVRAAAALVADGTLLAGGGSGRRGARGVRRLPAARAGPSPTVPAGRTPGSASWTSPRPKGTGPAGGGRAGGRGRTGRAPAGRRIAHCRPSPASRTTAA